MPPSDLLPTIAPISPFPSPGKTPSNLQALFTQRERLKVIASRMDEALRDFDGILKDANTQAGYAVAWAAVVMAADIVKTAMSSTDVKAGALFEALDAGIERANRLGQMLGLPTLETRGDALAGIEPGYRTTVQLLGSTHEARDILSKIGVKAPPKLDVFLSIALTMAEDVLLLLSAADLQKKVKGPVEGSRSLARHHLEKIRRQLRALDEAIVDQLERKARQDRTA